MPAGEAGDPAAPPLLSTDPTSQELLVLRQILDALGEIKLPWVIRSMIVLVYEDNEMKHATATQSLRALGEPLLTEAVQTETDSRIRIPIRTFLDSMIQHTPSDPQKSHQGTQPTPRCTIGDAGMGLSGKGFFLPGSPDSFYALRPSLCLTLDPEENELLGFLAGWQESSSEKIFR